MNARTKLIGTIAVGAALFVPVAQAQSPDDRAGLRGPGGIAAQQAGGASSHPDNRAVRGTAVAAPITKLAVRPDDRAGARGPGAYSPVNADDRRDLASGQPRREPRAGVDRQRRRRVQLERIRLGRRDDREPGRRGSSTSPHGLLLPGGEPAEQDAPRLIRLPTKTAAAGKRPRRRSFACIGYSGWQRGQYHVPRPPTRVFVIVARQRGQGSPSRP